MKRRERVMTSWGDKNCNKNKKRLNVCSWKCVWRGGGRVQHPPGAVAFQFHTPAHPLCFRFAAQRLCKVGESRVRLTCIIYQAILYFSSLIMWLVYENVLKNLVLKELAVFWVMRPCDLVYVCGPIGLLMETASTSETSVKCYQTTRPWEPRILQHD
jgi:hypothetical protein